MLLTTELSLQPFTLGFQAGLSLGWSLLGKPDWMALSPRDLLVCTSPVLDYKCTRHTFYVCLGD